MSPTVIRHCSTRFCVLYRCVLVWVLVWSVTTVAFGAAPVLLMVRTSDVTDPTPYELRLRSELAAEGIDAIVTNPVGPGGDVRQMAARFGTNAVVDVVVSTNELNTTIWAGDANVNIEVTRQLRVSNLQRDAVAVFALRTVDFLQGARLELEQQRRAKLALANSNTANGQVGNAQPPPTTPPQPNPERIRPAPAKVPLGARVVPPRARQRPVAKPAVNRFRAELGYVLMLTSDDFGWSTAPTLSFSYHLQSRWAFGATFAGPFVNHVKTTSGQYRITVDQELLQLELRRAFPLSPKLALEPYLGMGGSRYAADGRASLSPLVGNLATAWSVYNAAGAKAVYGLGLHLHLVADVAGFGRWQAPGIRVDIGDLTGRSRWNLLMKFGLAWSF